ncbi:hypothetical protein B4U80_13753 [Leptotrombidium deliense]|uniref:Uncharacterized protein n=1 Tax=Leptotrombidium deliense TaxID=299467 RepID=A0A443SGN0_9ACAR|nr:hypothetical protein B4U80_13753 [Leptotrombidium deliense]
MNLYSFISDVEMCSRIKIDALFAVDKESVVVFNDNYFLQFNVNKKKRGRILLVNDVWTEISTPIDSVSSFTINSSILFKNESGDAIDAQNTFWLYEDTFKYKSKQKLLLSGSVNFDVDPKPNEVSLFEQMLTNETNAISAFLCSENSLSQCLLTPQYTNETVVFQIGNIFNETCNNQLCMCMNYSKYLKPKHCSALEFDYIQFTPFGHAKVYVSERHSLFVYNWTEANETTVTLVKQLSLKYDVYDCGLRLKYRILLVILFIAAIVIIDLLVCLYLVKKRTQPEDIETEICAAVSKESGDNLSSNTAAANSF